MSHKNIVAKKCCTHCGSEIDAVISQSKRVVHNFQSDALFCCSGCATAWQLVNDMGLESFYRMTGGKELRTPSVSDSIEYHLFDLEEFQNSFVTRSPESGNSLAEVVLEGVTCYACVWLIRSALNRKYSDVHIDINQTTGAASIEWNTGQYKLSELIQFIDLLGYKVNPHFKNQLATDRRELIRVGVGVFLMMNVMSFSLVEYLTGHDGLDLAFELYLRWISAALTVVALMWPGRAFLINTWRSFKARAPHIDAPILAGLLGAFIYSVYNTWRAHGDVYFDSICAVCALVIAGRYMQSQALYRNRIKMTSLIRPRDGFVLVKNNDAFEYRSITSVTHGQTLRVLPGDMLQLRTRCISSCGEISFKELSGEPEWREIASGELIPAGAVNGTNAIEVRAEESGGASYVHALSKMIEKAIQDKGRYQSWSHQASWMLFGVVAFLTLIVLVRLFPTMPEEAIGRCVAILLVACPCTFAIGAPLVFGTAMTQALSEGILFRSQRVLEKFAQVKDVVFDKTGTLTYGDPRVTKVMTHDRAIGMVDLPSVLASLERYSSHHVCQSVSRWARTQYNLESTANLSVEEEIGCGLAIQSGVQNYKLGHQTWMESQGVVIPSEYRSATVLLVDDQGVLLGFTLSDSIRGESKAALDLLSNRNITTSILSGDILDRTHAVARVLGVSEERSVGNTSPAGKALFIRKKIQERPVAMVGNGLNDSSAMAKANVSIAVKNASSMALTSADICLLEPDLRLIARAWDLSRMAVVRLRAVFGFAVAYNFFGITLAVTGHVSPVVAAVLMPISSLTITKIATSRPEKRESTLLNPVEA